MQSVSGSAHTLEDAAQSSAELRSVYVIDDQAAARRATFLLLSGQGFAPRPFQSAQDFIDNVDHLQPGCVLLGDVQDQLGTTRLIGSLGDRVHEFPIVITTAHGDVATAIQAMKLGATDVLELPFGRCRRVAHAEPGELVRPRNVLPLFAV